MPEPLRYPSGMENLGNLLPLVEDVARVAGARLREATGNYRQVNSATARDIKMQADVESEKLIRELLRKETDFPIIGEEEGGDASLPSAEKPYWVVDPLDGTYNYHREQPLCAVSIGLMCGDQPLLGAVYDFYHDEMFSGYDGGGIALNGERFTPAWAQTTEQAVVGTGMPSVTDFSTPALQRLVTQIQRFKKVRMLGSASIMAAYVAAGRLDVYFENGVRLWDVAAGLALAKAAGGVFRMHPVDAAPFAYDVCIAGKETFFV